MNKSRLEAFSDGVIAIIITIMVLELKIPIGDDWKSLQNLAPKFISYLISFIYIAIYWNNHHHLIHTVKHRYRWNFVGKYPFIVLAFARSVCNGMGRRKSFF